ncbi:XrtA/PEP-CTERM system exopolysaccharide export protein [Reinekea blandensis]|uniref:Periplasmic protein involved in polysaccharide export n=1 Tax=Reinekea blandensis MED297 TaxID=314283 RepID=A4B971_9GAMM|nr:XrtA/PEP-CTERM system exopolysaccharide export protein [Reinekea blandensis]EAR11172.1 Periplasmic protein involved in polysaccharide export [Reinekea sp. MED297] [Reinekea blandensis MED297]
MSKTLRLLALGLVSVLVFGCASRGVDSIAQPERTYKQQSYVIGISDQLTIDVWRNQDLSRSVIVRPDGFITMPLMGDVRAESRTPEALAEVISVALRQVIKTPEVTVTVTNPVSIAYQYRVRAMGQVNQPTSIAFVEGMTVMDLVLAAGGVSDYGAGNRAILNRETDQGTREYPVFLDDILNEGDIRTNYLLQPADILTIPEKSIWRGEF